MLYSQRLSTASGNSGAEQFNIRSSVPARRVELVGKDIIPDIIKNEDLIKEAEEVLDKIEDAVFDAKDTLFKVEFEKDSFNEPEEDNFKGLEEETADESLENDSEISLSVEIVNEDESELTTNETLTQENKLEDIKTLDIIEENARLEEKVSQVVLVSNESENLSGLEPCVVKDITVDIGEVIGGFEEARSVINGLYKTVFNSSFTPTLNDVVADLLAYIGAKAEEYNKQQEYLKAFGIETSRFADRYRQKSYIPLCFKISVWADKNKNLNETVELLNGVLRTLFAFNVSDSEVEMVKKVSESISSIIEYLNAQGVESGF